LNATIITHQNPNCNFRQTPLHTYYYMNMEHFTIETKMNESW
jgi:hypothetical protein